LLGSVADQLALVTGAVGCEVRADPAELLTIRSGLGGLTRQGQVSIGRLARLVRAADGWCAVTLSRGSDLASVPAILGVLGADVAAFADLAGEIPDIDAGWAAIEAVARVTPASELAGAAQLLGVAAAALARRPTPEAAPWPPWRTRRIAEAFTAVPSPAGLPPTGLPPTASLADSSRADSLPFDLPTAVSPASSPAAAPPTGSPSGRLAGAVVADLSTMWAGPLCARLLGLAGARVIKVEAPDRLDGVRDGVPGFYDWLHAGHESLVIDFRSPAGRSALAALLDVADVVIEASRPRALETLGLAPEMIPHQPGQVWLSITGHGRDRPGLVAFGHDAAAAGGLVGWIGAPGAPGAPHSPGPMDTPGRMATPGTRGDAEALPVFCADAVADPLTGIVGALAVARSIEAGGGELIDLPMSGVAACFAAGEIPDHGGHEVRSDGTVFCQALGISHPILPPRVPEVTWGRAAEPGADNESVLSWLSPVNHACH